MLKDLAVKLTVTACWLATSLVIVLCEGRFVKGLEPPMFALSLGTQLVHEG